MEDVSSAAPAAAAAAAPSSDAPAIADADWQLVAPLSASEAQEALAQPALQQPPQPQQQQAPTGSPVQSASEDAMEDVSAKDAQTGLPAGGGALSLEEQRVADTKTQGQGQGQGQGQQQAGAPTTTTAASVAGDTDMADASVVPSAAPSAEPSPSSSPLSDAPATSPSLPAEALSASPMPSPSPSSSPAAPVKEETPASAAASPSATAAATPAAATERPAPTLYRLTCSQCAAVISFAWPARLVHCMVCQHVNAVSRSRATEHASNPLPALSLKQQAEQWTTLQVCVFLRSLKLEHLQSVFEANHVDGRQLLSLTYYDVRDVLRITQQGDIDNVLNCVAILRGEPVPTPNDPLPTNVTTNGAAPTAAAVVQQPAGNVTPPATAVAGGEAVRVKDEGMPAPVNAAATVQPVVAPVAAIPAPVAVAPVQPILAPVATQPIGAAMLAQRGPPSVTSSIAHFTPAAHAPPVSSSAIGGAPLSVSLSSIVVPATSASASASASASGGASSPSPSVSTSVASLAASTLAEGGQQQQQLQQQAAMLPPSQHQHAGHQPPVGSGAPEAVHSVIATQHGHGHGQHAPAQPVSSLPLPTVSPSPSLDNLSMAHFPGTPQPQPSVPVQQMPLPLPQVGQQQQQGNGADSQVHTQENETASDAMQQ